MPEISRFFGIVIRMFYREHGPPHFHAVYGTQRGVVDLQSGTVTGDLPPRAVKLILEWFGLHREELLRDWELARENKPLQAIEPLE